MFDLKIDLFDRRVQFDPSVASNANESGIRDIINKIVRDIIALATKMQRLDSQGQVQTSGDYLVEIRDQFELFFSIQRISSSLDDMETVCAKFLNQYDNFSFLWEKELETAFKEFLETGKDIQETFEEDLQKMIEQNGWEKEDPQIE
jgi:hypothetical protein